MFPFSTPMGRVWLAASLCLALQACAPTIDTLPATELAQPVGPAKRAQLLAPAAIKLDTGYSRELAAKSTWLLIGRLPQGDVYRPIGTILTIEGRQVHEAYLVIRNNTLVGFYLPGEQNYSPLTTTVPLNLGELE
ncbi:hypothetical protein [Cupriavidus pauculus]|uniref:Lipoprotein n=1 Tax=Cupriavidus pauculus TaxID=82633 RepID=A0A2N5C4U1_9BURK|nr:hypothetical protein [Cupriavidus pauculus]PLP97245.1 hypothetical protein CYJ10_28435 [Cupriavidus pauculus]